MAPKLIWCYLVCADCRDPLYLEAWRTPLPQKPPGAENIAIKTLYFILDEEQESCNLASEGKEAAKKEKLDILYAIASLEDLCKPREDYLVASSAGGQENKLFHETIIEEFQKHCKKSTPCCPCQLCHEEFRTEGWEHGDISAMHDACSLM